MPASNGFHDGFLDLPARPGKPRTEGLTHVIDKGLNLRDIEGMFDTGGAFVDIKLGWGTSYVTQQPREEDRALPSLRDAGRLRRDAVRGGLRAATEMDEFKAWLKEHRFSHVEISDGTRRDPARDEARADRRLRARLHRPLRGRLEGRRGDLRAVPVGRVDQGGARRRRLEGDHRGPRGRHRRHLPAERRDANRADRRDRPRGRRSATSSSRRRRRRARPGSSSTSART